eukprot:m.102186 g.102186  ORF g.102186 m.102186 type:complete len:192 (-) comp13218_c0_seq8:4308-4883(-)
MLHYLHPRLYRLPWVFSICSSQTFPVNTASTRPFNIRSRTDHMAGQRGHSSVAPAMQRDSTTQLHDEGRMQVANLYNKLARKHLSRSSEEFLRSALTAYQSDRDLSALMLSLGRILRQPKALKILPAVMPLIHPTDLNAYRQDSFLWQHTRSPRKSPMKASQVHTHLHFPPAHLYYCTITSSTHTHVRTHT